MALVVAIGSVLAAVVLSAGSSTAPATTFAPGETVTVPDAGAVRGPLTVYGTDTDVEGSTTLALGCEVVSPGGSTRVVVSAPGADPVQVEGTPVVPLVQSSGWRPGDQVTCSGEEAASFAPLALGVSGVPGTARVVALVLAVLGLLMGVLLLLIGTRVLRRR